MKNRICNKFDEAPLFKAPSETDTLEIKALLLSSYYKAPTSAWGDAVFAAKHQGRDCPGALRLLTQPYAERNLSLSRIVFRIIGKDRKHYEAELVASGPPGLLSEVAAEVNGNPIVYRFVNGLPTIRTSPCSHPFIADIHATFGIDEPGLVDYLVELASKTPGIPSAISDDGVHVQQNASIVELNAELLNDGGLAEGGTPGFQIRAQLVAPSKSALDDVLHDWSLFCIGHDALRSIYSDDNGIKAACELQVRERGNTTLLPTHFLVAA